MGGDLGAASRVVGPCVSSMRSTETENIVSFVKIQNRIIYIDLYLLNKGFSKIHE